MDRFSCEELFVLNLLKRSLFGIDFSFDYKKVNWQKVYDISLNQAVLPLVYEGTKGLNIVPKEFAKKFKQSTLSIIFKNENLLEVQEEITNQFHKQNLDYVVIKGFSSYNDYSLPNLRVEGDIDLVVSADDYERCDQLLISLGAKRYIHIKDDGHHGQYFMNGARIEVHCRMSEIVNTKYGLAIDEYCLDFLENKSQIVIGDYSFNILNEKFRFLSLSLHLEKHFRIDSFGLRHLCDWAVFMKNNDFNDEWYSFLNEFKFKNFCLALNSLCVKFLGINDDVQQLNFEVEEKNIDSFMIDIFRNGNFFGNSTKEDMVARRAVNAGYYGHLKENRGFLNYLVRNINFYYPNSKIKPILYIFSPIILICRYFGLVIKGKRKSVSLIKIFNQFFKERKLQSHFRAFYD